MLQIQVSSASPSPTHSPTPHRSAHTLSPLPSPSTPAANPLPPVSSPAPASTSSSATHPPQSPTVPASPAQITSLVDLSRNASVISSSSSSSSTSSLLNSPPPRPRPIRTFSSPRRSRSREVGGGPSTPRASRAPAYLAKEFGLDVADEASGGGNAYTYGYSNGGTSANASRRGSSSTNTTISAGDGAGVGLGVGSPTKRALLNERPLARRAESQPRSKSRTKSRNSSAGMGVTAEDFKFGEVLGEGSYSTVMHAVYPPTGQEYAIKIIDKGHLQRNDKLHTAFAEKNALVKLGSGHPGIVRLHRAFRDEWSLYFVLDLAKNGELRTRISELGSLSVACARYYAAQMVDAVAYMHSKDIIHRDLKPENMLLDADMRLKITDFGTSKILELGVDSAKTFVGTAQYQAPELLTANKTTKSSDLWALGCVIYQMLAGRFPFHGLSDYLIWQKIKNLEYTFPDDFDPLAKDLVQQLLVLDPEARLGAGKPGSGNGVEALKAHPFFEKVEWTTLWSVPAPELEAGIVKREKKARSADGRGIGGEGDEEFESGVGGAWEGFAWVRGDGVFGRAGYGGQDAEGDDGADDGVEQTRDGVDYVSRYNDYSEGGAEIGPFDPLPVAAQQSQQQQQLSTSIPTRLQTATPNTRADAVVNSTPFPVIPNGTPEEPTDNDTTPAPASSSSPSTSPGAPVQSSSSSPIDIRNSISAGSATSSSEGGSPSPVEVEATRSAMERLGVGSGSGSGGVGAGLTSIGGVFGRRIVRGKGGFVVLNGRSSRDKKTQGECGNVTTNASTSTPSNNKKEREQEQEQEHSRGRNPSQTPIQLTPSVPMSRPIPSYPPVFHVGEVSLFDSPVEFRTRTRRLTATLSLSFSRNGSGSSPPKNTVLDPSAVEQDPTQSHPPPPPPRQRSPISIPLPVPQARWGVKQRHLYLTPDRVLCVKVKKGITRVKWEASFSGGVNGGGGSGVGDAAGMDNAKLVITDVVRKGEKAFVVVTNGKSQLFGTHDAKLAERWIEEVRKTLDATKVRPSGSTERGVSPVTKS